MRLRRKLRNPVACLKAWGYLPFVHGEQRRVELGVIQAPPFVEMQLRGLVRDMSRRARMLPTAAERISMIRDGAIFYVAFITIKRCFELWASAASQVLQRTGGEGVVFLFPCSGRRYG